VRSPDLRPRTALTAGVVIVVAAASFGAWAVTRPTAPGAPSYLLVAAARTTMRQALSSTGTIEPATTATLSFGAPGEITAVQAKVGQHVTQGQTLATMDSATLKAQAAQATAGLAGAQSQLAQDEASSASNPQLTADQASVNAAQSQVDSANAALSGTVLTAPIDGIVTTVGLTVGPTAGGGGDGTGGGADVGSEGAGDTGSGGDSGGGGDTSDAGGGGDAEGSSGSGSTGSGSSASSITVISAHDVIDADVDASQVGQIKTGDQVVITTNGAPGPVAGRVASIGLTADTSSGVATFPLVIDVTGTPSGLYAGASATVSIIYNQLTGVLAVPTAAVRPSGGRTVVYTMVHGRQVARPVTIGLTTGGQTQITSGLTAGERVVVAIPRDAGRGSRGNSGGGNVFLFGPGGGLPGGGNVRIRRAGGFVGGGPGG
jgi:macrolide-specific efflux system membrane fusion protein